MLASCVIAIVAAIACGRDPGPARVRPLPSPEIAKPLRGGGPARSPRIANYTIDVRLDPERHTLSATETLVWTNTGATPVDYLPFHLYLNAFKNETTLFMRTSRGRFRGTTVPGAWGWIEIDKVEIGGADVTASLRWPGPDETVVEVPLTTPVAPGEQITVAFTFTAQLPEVFARTGYKGEFHLVGQWFPKIGVRTGAPGAERWECAPFHAHAEFFADFGTYDVSITVPSTYVIAATGVMTNAIEAPGGTRTFTYRAEDVHDFAWMADPYMEVTEGTAHVEDGLVQVRIVHRPAQKDFARRHLDAATGAIQRFSAYLLPYPWPVITVVDPPLDAVGGAGGMEYPMFVTTGGDSVFAREGMRLPEYVTVHEVGHNWFGGMLASNEVTEAWLDEGLDEWLAARVMADLWGARGSGLDWMGWQAEVTALRNAVTADPSALPSPFAAAADAFVDFDAYTDATYLKTARALATLENLVGRTKLDAAMKSYARAWAFKHPTGDDLFAHLERTLAVDLAWFRQAFVEPGGIEVALRDASCKAAHPPRGVFGRGAERKDVESKETGTFVCEVVITNLGRIHVPVDVELIFADGGTQRLTWDGEGTWERFVVERSARLVEVRLDPDKKLALANPVEHHRRLEPDGSASARAAAWAGSLAQTLMQIVGP